MAMIVPFACFEALANTIVAPIVNSVKRSS
jgi:hypothetical protein